MGLTPAEEFVIGFVVAASYVVLIAAFAFQEIRHSRMINRMLAREQDLLNRLMARDLTEYANAQRALPVSWKHIMSYMKRQQKQDAEGEEDEEARREDGGMPVA